MNLNGTNIVQELGKDINMKKYITDFKHRVFTKKWQITSLIFLSILFVAVFVRSLKILHGQQPIFADEAIYVRWAQVMKAEPTLRFLPLSDGKQPLYMWILMFILHPGWDPLITGRFLSLVFGMLSVLGVFVLSYILFKSKKVSLTASLLYALSPFMVFFESMALVDSTLTSLGVWFVIFLLLSLKYFRLDLSMISGFLLGGALLTKSPALYYAVLAPLIVFFESLSKSVPKTIEKILKNILLLIPIFIIAYGIYNILRLGPNFHLISARNSDYVFPISQLWNNPDDPFISHIKEIFEWLWKLGPGVLVFIIVLGFLTGLKKFPKNICILSVIILLPLFANAMYAKVFTARYILFVLPFIYILASLFILFKSKFQKLSYLMLTLYVVNSLLVNFLLIYKIQEAPLPKSERTGYLEEWTAGYGIKNVADYLRNYHIKNPGNKIVVGTEGYFGTLPDGLQLYLNDLPEITIIGIGLSIKEIPSQLRESREYGNDTFLVINSSRLNKDFNYSEVELIFSFIKPDRTVNTHDYVMYGPRETFYFYKVL